jgi:hypothetical protein
VVPSVVVGTVVGSVVVVGGVIVVVPGTVV